MEKHFLPQQNLPKTFKIVCKVAKFRQICLPTMITSGQSYKAYTIVIYDSRVIPNLKIPHITTLES